MLPGAPSAVRYEAVQPVPVEGVYSNEAPWLVCVFSLSISTSLVSTVSFWGGFFFAPTCLSTRSDVLFLYV